MKREWFTLTVFNESSLAGELNRLERAGWTIWQVVYGVNLYMGNFIHRYTIIYNREAT